MANWQGQPGYSYPGWNNPMAVSGVNPSIPQPMVPQVPYYGNPPLATQPTMTQPYGYPSSPFYQQGLAQGMIPPPVYTPSMPAMMPAVQYPPQQPAARTRPPARTLTAVPLKGPDQVTTPLHSSSGNIQNKESEKHGETSSKKFNSGMKGTKRSSSLERDSRRRSRSLGSNGWESISNDGDCQTNRNNVGESRQSRSIERDRRRDSRGHSFGRDGSIDRRELRTRRSRSTDRHWDSRGRSVEQDQHVGRRDSRERHTDRRDSRDRQFMRGDSRDKQFVKGDSRDRQVVRGDSRDRQIDRRNSRDKQFVRGDSRERQFVSGNSRDRQFVRGDSRDRQFVRGDSRDRQIVRGDSRDRQFVRGDSRDRQFVSGDSRDRQFVRGDSRDRQFVRGDSSDRQFDRRNSRDKQFVRGNSRDRQFVRGGSRDRQLVSGDSRDRHFVRGDSRDRQIDRRNSRDKQFVRGNSRDRQFVRGDSRDRQLVSGDSRDRHTDRQDSRYRQFVRGNSRDRLFVRGDSRDRHIARTEDRLCHGDKRRERDLHDDKRDSQSGRVGRDDRDQYIDRRSERDQQKTLSDDRIRPSDSRSYDSKTSDHRDSRRDREGRNDKDRQIERRSDREQQHDKKEGTGSRSSDHRDSKSGQNDDKDSKSSARVWTVNRVDDKVRSIERKAKPSTSSKETKDKAHKRNTDTAKKEKSATASSSSSDIFKRLAEYKKKFNALKSAKKPIVRPKSAASDKKSGQSPVKQPVKKSGQSPVKQPVKKSEQGRVKQPVKRPASDGKSSPQKPAASPQKRQQSPGQSRAKKMRMTEDKDKKPSDRKGGTSKGKEAKAEVEETVVETKEQFMKRKQEELQKKIVTQRQKMVEKRKAEAEEKETGQKKMKMSEDEIKTVKVENKVETKDGDKLKDKGKKSDTSASKEKPKHKTDETEKPEKKDLPKIPLKKNTKEDNSSEAVKADTERKKENESVKIPKGKETGSVKRPNADNSKSSEFSKQHKTENTETDTKSSLNETTRGRWDAKDKDSVKSENSSMSEQRAEKTLQEKTGIEQKEIKHQPVKEEKESYVAKDNRQTERESEKKIVESKIDRSEISEVLKMVFDDDEEMGEIVGEAIFQATGEEDETAPEDQPYSDKVGTHPQSDIDRFISEMRDPDEPLIGLQYIVEIIHKQAYKRHNYRCFCCCCHVFGKSVTDHLVGLKHRMSYFERNQPEIFMRLKRDHTSKFSLNTRAKEDAKRVEREVGRQKIRCIEGVNWTGQKKHERTEVIPDVTVLRRMPREHAQTPASKPVTEAVKAEPSTPPKVPEASDPQDKHKGHPRAEYASGTADSKAQTTSIKAEIPIKQAETPHEQTEMTSQQMDTPKKNAETAGKQTETRSMSADIQPAPTKEELLEESIKIAVEKATPVSFEEGKHCVPFYRFIQNKPDVPMLGLSEVVEISGFKKGVAVRYLCKMCKMPLIEGPRAMLEHTQSLKHMEMYLERLHPRKVDAFDDIENDKQRKMAVDNQARLAYWSDGKGKLLVTKLEEIKPKPATTFSETQKTESNTTTSSPAVTSQSTTVAEAEAANIKHADSKDVKVQLFDLLKGLDNIPVVGLNYITEIQHQDNKSRPTYQCKLCETTHSVNFINAHLTSHDHRSKFLKNNYPLLHSRTAGNKELVYKYVKEIEGRYGRESVWVKTLLAKGPNGMAVYSEAVFVKGPWAPRVSAREKEASQALLKETVKKEDSETHEVVFATAMGGKGDNSVNSGPEFDTIIDGLDYTPLLGLQYITELQHPDRTYPAKYECLLCHHVGNGTPLTTANILNHITARGHRLNYFRETHEDMYKKIITCKDRGEQNMTLAKYTKEIESTIGRGVISHIVSTDLSYWTEEEDKAAKEFVEDSRREAKESSASESVPSTSTTDTTEASKPTETPESTAQEMTPTPLPAPALTDVPEKLQLLPKTSAIVRDIMLKKDGAFSWEFEYGKVQERLQEGSIIKSDRKSRYKTAFDTFYNTYPIIGVQWILEVQRTNALMEPYYLCRLCQERVIWKKIVNHVNGLRHRISYMGQCYSLMYHFICQKKFTNVAGLRVRVDLFAEEIVKKEGRKQEPQVLLELDASQISSQTAVSSQQTGTQGFKTSTPLAATAPLLARTSSVVQGTMHVSGPSKPALGTPQYSQPVSTQSVQQSVVYQPQVSRYEPVSSGYSGTMYQTGVPVSSSVQTSSHEMVNRQDYGTTQSYPYTQSNMSGVHLSATVTSPLDTTAGRQPQGEDKMYQYRRKQESKPLTSSAGFPFVKEVDTNFDENTTEAEVKQNLELTERDLELIEISEVQHNLELSKTDIELIEISDDEEGFGDPDMLTEDGTEVNKPLSEEELQAIEEAYMKRLQDDEDVLEELYNEESEEFNFGVDDLPEEPSGMVEISVSFGPSVFEVSSNHKEQPRSSAEIPGLTLVSDMAEEGMQKLVSTKSGKDAVAKISAENKCQKEGIKGKEGAGTEVTDKSINESKKQGKSPAAKVKSSDVKIQSKVNVDETKRVNTEPCKAKTSDQQKVKENVFLPQPGTSRDMKTSKKQGKSPAAKVKSSDVKTQSKVNVDETQRVNTEPCKAKTSDPKKVKENVFLPQPGTSKDMKTFALSHKIPVVILERLSEKDLMQKVSGYTTGNTGKSTMSEQSTNSATTYSVKRMKTDKPADDKLKGGQASEKVKALILKDGQRVANTTNKKAQNVKETSGLNRSEKDIAKTNLPSSSKTGDIKNKKDTDRQHLEKTSVVKSHKGPDTPKTHVPLSSRSSDMKNKKDQTDRQHPGKQSVVKSLEGPDTPKTHILSSSRADVLKSKIDKTDRQHSEKQSEVKSHKGPDTPKTQISSSSRADDMRNKQDKTDKQKSKKESVKSDKGPAKYEKSKTETKVSIEMHEKEEQESDEDDFQTFIMSQLGEDFVTVDEFEDDQKTSNETTNIVLTIGKLNETNSEANQASQQKDNKIEKIENNVGRINLGDTSVQSQKSSIETVHIKAVDKSLSLSPETSQNTEQKTILEKSKPEKVVQVSKQKYEGEKLGKNLEENRAPSLGALKGCEKLSQNASPKASTEVQNKQSMICDTKQITTKSKKENPCKTVVEIKLTNKSKQTEVKSTTETPRKENDMEVSKKTSVPEKHKPENNNDSSSKLKNVSEKSKQVASEKEDLKQINIESKTSDYTKQKVFHENAGNNISDKTSSEKNLTGTSVDLPTTMEKSGTNISDKTTSKKVLTETTDKKTAENSETVSVKTTSEKSLIETTVEKTETKEKSTETTVKKTTTTETGISDKATSEKISTEISVEKSKENPETIILHKTDSDKILTDTTVEITKEKSETHFLNKTSSEKKLTETNTEKSKDKPLDHKAKSSKKISESEASDQDSKEESKTLPRPDRSENSDINRLQSVDQEDDDLDELVCIDELEDDDEEEFTVVDETIDYTNSESDDINEDNRETITTVDEIYDESAHTFTVLDDIQNENDQTLTAEDDMLGENLDEFTTVDEVEEETDDGGTKQESGEEMTGDVTDINISERDTPTVSKTLNVTRQTDTVARNEPVGTPSSLKDADSKDKQPKPCASSTGKADAEKQLEKPASMSKDVSAGDTCMGLQTQKAGSKKAKLETSREPAQTQKAGSKKAKLETSREPAGSHSGNPSIGKHGDSSGERRNSPGLRYSSDRHTKSWKHSAVTVDIDFKAIDNESEGPKSKSGMDQRKIKDVSDKIQVEIEMKSPEGAKRSEANVAPRSSGGKPPESRQKSKDHVKETDKNKTSKVSEKVLKTHDKKGETHKTDGTKKDSVEKSKSGASGSRHSMPESARRSYGRGGGYSRSRRSHDSHPYRRHPDTSRRQSGRPSSHGDRSRSRSREDKCHISVEFD